MSFEIIKRYNNISQIELISEIKNNYSDNNYLNVNISQNTDDNEQILKALENKNEVFLNLQGYKIRIVNSEIIGSIFNKHVSPNLISIILSGISKKI